MLRHVIVIVICSNHGDLAGEPNGTYMPELTHALAALDQQGITYELASPLGGAIPGYGRDADALTKTMLADPSFAARLQHTKPLAEVDPERYDGVFYPGGHGLLFDLVGNQDAVRISAAIYERGGLVLAVCDGPAAPGSIGQRRQAHHRAKPGFGWRGRTCARQATPRVTACRAL